MVLEVVLQHDPSIWPDKHLLRHLVDMGLTDTYQVRRHLQKVGMELQVSRLLQRELYSLNQEPLLIVPR